LSEGGNLWTTSLLGELDQRFVKNLDAGEGDFLSKLKVQLSEGSPDCRRLMAESLWLTLLFPSNVSAAKKRENVQEIWSCSGEDLSATHPLLADAVLEGIGSAGTAYNTHRWRELVFLIGALQDFKVRDAADREQIASDPWAFSGWLSGLPEARHRQLIHILPHLLFPDTFERISSEGDKRLILAGFGDTPEKEIKKWSTVEIDRALLELRRRLEEEHGADIDFYQEEFESQWKNQTKNWLLSWNPSRWTWDTLAADRATTISGEKADNRWRCSSSKPHEGDRVFLTLGHSYFYHVKSFDELRRVFAREILPFLQEAFYDDWRQIRYVLADQAVEEELQLVRARTQNAAVLFPKADPTEIGDGEAFEIIREDDITPDAIRKIYEPPE